MKPLRVLLLALAVVVIAGTIAGATPGFDVPPKGQPEVTASPSPEPTETESPEPTETESPEPEETSSPKVTAQDAGVAPDFSGCAGKTGLDNAICRHEVLVGIHPDNPGLENSLTRLHDNLDRQQERAKATSHGPSGDHGASGDHGNPGGNH